MFAIVMYGTNDMQRSNLSAYTTNMNTIVDTIEARGTVPILSTIPPRSDSTSLANAVSDYNSVVRNLARTRHLPLIDLNLAMQPLRAQGLSSDGIHPNLYRDEGGTLTDVALAYGYNTRNLTFLQMMLRLMSY
jgi:lysophospholipase L1-like esterase